jgi:neutral ceramidase
VWLLAVLLLVLVAPVAARAAEWKAGVARVKITPRQPMWMSGYASRDRPAEGTLIDLWAKALALDDGEGHRAVLVTMDLCGIDRELSRRVCGAIESKHHLGRASIALCVSHTHSGPVVGNNLRPMYGLDERQSKLVDEYAAELEANLVSVADEALAALAPARLEWGVGRATFAVNRRNNKEEDVTKLREDGKLQGPVDHDLPVLVVRTPGRGPEGKPLAIVFGYACHATTLSFYQWSGDWPGYAQIEIENSYQGATAFFVAGCGADQNPLPRRTVELARRYGGEAASGVGAAIAAGLHPVAGPLRASYAEIDLPFAALPTREQVEKDATSKDRYVASRAKLLLSQWDRDGKLNPTYPYPVQVWRLGGGPAVVFLGGEVVVDYSLRLKRELGPEKTWVASYSNDVMAYVPSLRVLKEGGYEGGGAMLYYGLPSPWGDETEERIVREVVRQAQ